MTATLDLDLIRRLISRNCQHALTELGFDPQNESPIEYDFDYDDDNQCVGIVIKQNLS